MEPNGWSDQRAWHHHQHHHQQQQQAHARPPIGPALSSAASRPSSKRGHHATIDASNTTAVHAHSQQHARLHGAPAAGMHGSSNSWDNDEASAPERSFKRLKIEGAASAAAGPVVGSGLPVHVAVGSAGPMQTPAAPQHDVHHTHQNMQQQQQQQQHHRHSHQQQHQHMNGGGRPPIPHHQQHREYQAPGEQTADFRENNHRHFAPIRPPPHVTLTNAHLGPRSNSVTSSSAASHDASDWDSYSEVASAASYSGYSQHQCTSNTASNGNGNPQESYSNMNHMLGQLHAQRRQRHGQQHQHQQHHGQEQQQPGHQRRNTLSPNWGLSSNHNPSAPGAGQHPGPLGSLQHHHQQQYQQRQQLQLQQQQHHGQHHHGHRQQSQQQRQQVPSWRRSVRLPSSTNLY